MDEGLPCESPNSVTVYYYIPGDHDDVEHPNVFTVKRDPKSDSLLRLREVKAQFPLPGTYHFRFRVKYHNTPAWMDLSSDDAVVPVFDSKVVAKVLRVQWDVLQEEQLKSATKLPQSKMSVHSHDAHKCSNVSHHNGSEIDGFHLNSSAVSDIAPTHATSSFVKHQSFATDYDDLLLSGEQHKTVITPTETSQSQNKQQDSWKANFEDFFA